MATILTSVIHRDGLFECEDGLMQWANDNEVDDIFASCIAVV